MSDIKLRQVPFVDLGRQHERLRPELDAAFSSVIEASAFILGPAVEEFERKWAGYCGASHAIGVSSGTAAIHLVLEALGIGPGDEVIAPANTFIASVLPVIHLGARPVLVDCHPRTATIDVDAVAGAVTGRTRAVLAVHLYGRPAELDPLVELADRSGFALIEDACQAHGARYRGRRVGAIGRAGCFSFYPSKNLGALGDGGAVVTNDDELAQRIRLLRDLGQSCKYQHALAGHNDRLDALQAAVLTAKLGYLDGWNDARRSIAEWYGAGLEGVTVPQMEHDRDHVWHLYVVRTPERDKLRRTLAEAGIQTGLHYPTPIHLQEATRQLGYGEGDFPASETWSREGLSLPMFPELERHEVEFVANCVRKAFA